MEQYFFISDAHLGHSDPGTERNKEKLFKDFLIHVRKNAAGLFIVGDLFDFWFEYKHAIPSRYFTVLSELKKCTDSGVEIKYITGNHDFWMFDFFPKHLGIKVYKDFLELSILSKRFYITHGDGIAKKDYGYRVLKKIIQNKINISLFRLVHPDISFEVAGFFSRLSRNHREIKNQDMEYVEFAKQKFTEGFDCVVIGHTHRALEYHHKNKTYVNTGEWYEKFTFARFSGDKLTLENWPV